MTLKRLSKDDMIKDRAWVIALMSLFTFLWFGVIELISLNIIRGGEGASKEFLTSRLQETSTVFLGLGSYSFLLVWSFAIFFGIQGFSFLFDSKKVDFYLSQPVKRSTRFFSVYLGGILCYMAIMGCGMLLGLLVSVTRGGFYSDLILAMIMEYLNLLVQFVSMYSVTVLATLLCGNLFAAFCSVGFFLMAEIVIRGMIYALCETYLPTYPTILSETGGAGIMGNAFTSPILNYIAAAPLGAATQGVFTARIVFVTLAGLVPMLIKNILIGAGAFGLSFLAFEKRRAEYAGRTVAFPFMEHVYKCVTAWVGGTGMGLIIASIVSFPHDVPINASTLFGIVVGVFTVCVVAEGIFALNVRSVFHRAWQIPAVTAVCVISMMGFFYDWAGYDSYCPAADKLESITISPSGGYAVCDNYTYGDESTPMYERSFGKYMAENSKLKDMEAALAIASIGQKNIRNMQYDTDSYEYGENVTVIYRLKNKKVVTREAVIPANADEKLMDRILSDDDYAMELSGVVPADEVLADTSGKISMSLDMIYRTDGGYDDIGGLDETKEFLELYKADVAEYFSASLIRSSEPLCRVYITKMKGDEYTASLYFLVFPEYKRSIEYIENMGFDLSDEAFYKYLFEAAKGVKALHVEDQYPAMEDADTYHSDPFTAYTSESVGFASVDYDTAEKKQAILSKVKRSGGDSGYSYGLPFMHDERQYFEVYFDAGIDYGMTGGYRLYYDDAPDFVLEDFKK